MRLASTALLQYPKRLFNATLATTLKYAPGTTRNDFNRDGDLYTQATWTVERGQHSLVYRTLRTLVRRSYVWGHSVQIRLLPQWAGNRKSKAITSSKRLFTRGRYEYDQTTVRNTRHGSSASIVVGDSYNSSKQLRCVGKGQGQRSRWSVP